MKLPPTTGPLFIVMNEGSGRLDAQQRREAIARVTSRSGRAHRLMSFDRRKPIAEVAAQAVREARSSGGIVVAAGGDGTINAVVQAVVGSGCSFGVLPQGTFNYFARNHLYNPFSRLFVPYRRYSRHFGADLEPDPA